MSRRLCETWEWKIACKDTEASYPETTLEISFV